MSGREANPIEHAGCPGQTKSEGENVQVEQPGPGHVIIWRHVDGYFRLGKGTVLAATSGADGTLR
jgi:hypothetical protein